MYLLEPKLVDFYISILDISEHNRYLDKNGWLGDKPMPKAVFKKTVKKKKDFDKLETEVINICGGPENLEKNIHGLIDTIGRC